MTDLNTRIAKATWESHRDRQLAQLGMKPSEYPADIPIPDWAYAIADGVISELGLRLEYGTSLVTGTISGLFRYVTNWKADDE